MLPGFNTDIQHESSSYHIQTEDNGEANPVIISLVYRGGAILSRKKTDYRHLLQIKDYREEVHRIMREQHREMIKLIKSGKLESQPPAEPPPEKPLKSRGNLTLDEEIMEFLSEMED